MNRRKTGNTIAVGTQSSDGGRTWSPLQHIGPVTVRVDYSSPRVHRDGQDRGEQAKLGHRLDRSSSERADRDRDVTRPTVDGRDARTPT